MSDHRRLRAGSPIRNPARMSAPAFGAGFPTVSYERAGDQRANLHAIPTRREKFTSPRSSGASIETHYKIKPDTLAAPPPDRSRSRRKTIDSSSQPIIVTPTYGYKVPVGEPSSARASRDSDLHISSSYDEQGYVQPASSQHHRRDRDREHGYRGSRSQHTIDNADISERHPHDRESVNDRLLRVGSARGGQIYPPERPRPITDNTLVRHPDTVKDDYGDNGYGYTNPKDLVEYDLESTVPRRSGSTLDPGSRRSRRESWDNSRGGRPVSISGYGDLRTSRAERERGPPPTTRGFDMIPGDRNPAYHGPGEIRMPMPHDHIPGSPLAQAPAYAGDNLGMPQRRTSTRRPVSVYNDDRERRDRSSRDDYDIRPRRQDTFEDDAPTRGFGIRPDLMPPSNVITVEPPAPVDRYERDDHGHRDEKRYHDRDEKRYYDRERDERRDERRPDHDDHDGRKAGGIAAGSIAAAAMGLGATAGRDQPRETRHSDEERERDRTRRHRRDSDEYYHDGRRRREHKEEEPPAVDLAGRDPKERMPLRDERAPRDREYRDERDRDSDRRERDRDSDGNRRDRDREQPPRRESPLQSEKVDLSDRHPVIERNVAKEDSHYPVPSPRSSPPSARREREPDADSVADAQRRGLPRRDKIYEDSRGGETIASPVAMNDKEARDLRALREEMGISDTSPPPPRPPKEPIEPTVGFARQDTDQISERPLDPPSRSGTLEREAYPVRTGEPASLRTETSNASSRPSFSQRDRGYSSTSTSSASSRQRSRSREKTSSGQGQNTVRVVSPPRSPSSSQATLPVKGILKRRDEPFPEPPPEERPGVAPLIDRKTGKNWDGREMADVPPTARWTKISRKMVNPEALEKGNERYEVRDDFVVVLRVLTKDEIQGYAVITQRIRAEREDEEREKRRERRYKDEGNEETDGDRDDRRRRRRGDDDETEEERADRKRKERERDEVRRRKYDGDETEEERAERKARDERHRRRREEREKDRRGHEGETADEYEERKRRERKERSERHRRERRERRGGRDDDDEDEKEREERHRRHRERRDREREREVRSERDRERERERDKAKDESSSSDTTEDERDAKDDRRRRRRD